MNDSGRPDTEPIVDVMRRLRDRGARLRSDALSLRATGNASDLRRLERDLAAHDAEHLRVLTERRAEVVAWVREDDEQPDEGAEAFVDRLIRDLQKGS